jgi:hypothetical protein
MGAETLGIVRSVLWSGDFGLSYGDHDIIQMQT